MDQRMEGDVSLGKVTPVLRIFDEAKALEFYVGFMGFELAWKHRLEAGSPVYLAVRRGECELHLTEHHGDCSPGATIRIETRELDAFHAELAAKHYAYARPGIETMPWGSREMSIRDPFFNRITFACDASQLADPDFKVSR
ncbi:MAG TPA: glyoxalase superfamily protein [Polyangiaceae bacterium]|nr:glyoxalase superfamily protein [Polyangiaceae bacterium]